MPEQVQILRIVVASPGDVQPERDLLPDVVAELNQGIAADRGLRLELIRWETDAYPGFHPEGPQGLIDPILKIDHSDVLIGIFWTRFGTRAKGMRSGTEHEFRTAFESWKNKKRPQIMVYFNQKPYTPKTKNEADQWGAVLKFKEKFPKEGLARPYNGKAQFRELVRKHLTQFIRNWTPVPPAPPLAVWPPPPQQPGLFVGRQEGLQELKRRLGIGAEEPVAASHMQHITVVFGVPGVGKTTLAAALAYDPNVRQAFPDGILWTSLGEKPALLSVLSRCGDSFRDEGKRLVAANTLTAAVDELTNLLKEKRMLLIVDDVWETEPAATFKRVRGPGCTLVMTTRDREVASDLADRSAKEQVYRLSPLTDENGLQLLRELARSVVDRYREKCLELVRALEGLPLALQVAGRLLHAEAEKERGLVEKLLDELRTGKKLLEARAPADRMDLERQTIPTVAVLLKHSIDRLDKTTRNHFALLGTGPRPAIFSTPTLRNLWRVRDPQPTIDVLIKRGLLEPLGDGRYQMHALLVALADSLLTDE
jgi:hypothetical protein